MRRKTKWYKIEEHYSTDLPLDEVPGVYAIYFLNQIIYIGTSHNLKKRLRHHGFGVPERFVNDFIRNHERSLGISIKMRPEKVTAKRFELELKLIRRLRPRSNNTDDVQVQLPYVEPTLCPELAVF